MSKKHTASSAEAIPFDGMAAIAYAISCVPEYERKLLKIYQKDSDAYDQRLNPKDRFLQSALYRRLDVSSQIHLRHIYSVFATMTEAEIYAYIHKNCYRFVKPFQKEQSFETYQDAVYGSDKALSWQGIHVAILFTSSSNCIMEWPILLNPSWTISIFRSLRTYDRFLFRSSHINVL